MKDEKEKDKKPDTQDKVIDFLHGSAVEMQHYSDNEKKGEDAGSSDSEGKNTGKAKDSAG